MTIKVKNRSVKNGNFSSATKSNVTLVVKTKNNDVYLDPTIAANSNDIDNNIKDNFKNCLKAFKDDDSNGLPD